MDESFDSKESPLQNITFTYTEKKVWEKVRMDYAGIAELRTENGKYSNLALMLSDQCPWTTEIEISGRKGTIGGPVLKQYYEILDAICNIEKPNPEKKYTVERYPKRVIREAAVNAVVHRNYGMDEPITVCADLESANITSPGGVWVTDKKENGPLARNSGLAKFFRALEGFSFRGNGITSIKHCYRMTPQMPSASFTDSHFTINLPAISVVSSAYEIRKEKIENIIAAFNGASVSTIAENTMLSPQYTRRILKRMEGERIIFCTGCGRKNIYYLCSKRDNGRQTRTMRWITV
jgi:hypothetical protein